MCCIVWCLGCGALLSAYAAPEKLSNKPTMADQLITIVSLAIKTLK